MAAKTVVAFVYGHKSIPKRFKLLNRIIKEIDLSPYTADRGDIRRAIVGKNNVVKVTTLFLSGDGSVPSYYGLSESRGKIEIGCMHFIGKEATKLRKWALEVK